jgi:hypothetical protein
VLTTPSTKPGVSAPAGSASNCWSASTSNPSPRTPPAQTRAH